MKENFNIEFQAGKTALDHFQKVDKFPTLLGFEVRINPLLPDNVLACVETDHISWFNFETATFYRIPKPQPFKITLPKL